MKRRKLGKLGLDVSAIGLGCMGMSFAYGGGDDNESIKVLHRALDIGMTFWDTAEMYGPFKNEELLGRALKGKDRTKIQIATKFAFKFDAKGNMIGLDSSPANVKRAVEGSLRRLGTDHVDLLYQHRVDPATPIEETVGAMADLVKAGKVRYLGLSEAGPGTIRRAHKVHPITALQTEYSMWERDVEEKVLPTVRELGIGFVAYSPVGRGFLTGKFKSPADLAEGDWRRQNPRFLEENFRRNMQLVESVRAFANEADATPAQMALAWLLNKGDDIVPIPGTRHVKFLEENAAAADLSLAPDLASRLNCAAESFQTAGQRYPEGGMKTIDRS